MIRWAWLNGHRTLERKQDRAMQAWAMMHISWALLTLKFACGMSFRGISTSTTSVFGSDEAPLPNVSDVLLKVQVPPSGRRGCEEATPTDQSCRSTYSPLTTNSRWTSTQQQPVLGTEPSGTTPGCVSSPSMEVCFACLGQLDLANLVLHAPNATLAS